MPHGGGHSRTARLGFIADFLSLPILTGFLNGIALLIIAGQMPTALEKIDETRGQLAVRGIVLAVARRKRTLERFFEARWINARRRLVQDHNFDTLRAAVRAFNRRGERD